MTLPTPAAEAAPQPDGEALREPVHEPRPRPARAAQEDLRAGMRWAAVILTLSLVVVAAILWTAERPFPGPTPLPQPADTGAVGQGATSRLAADPPLTDVNQDQGNPVPLPDGSTLWVFADTAHMTQKPFFFRTSSAAVTAPGSTRMTFLHGADGTPVEFLPRSAEEHAQQTVDAYVPIWPTGAVALPDGRIIVSYTKWYVTRRPGIYGFTMLSSGLYEYRYPGSPAGSAPARRIADELWSADEGSVGSPVYLDGYVYFQVCPEKRCYSLRTTPDRLADRSSYRWYTGTGWSPRINDRQPMEFGGGRPGRNPALARLPSGTWAMTDVQGGKGSQEGLLWVAATPYGPWSEPVRFPLRGCISFGCYAVIPHPQQSTDRRLRIGYTTFGRSMFIYLLELPIRIGRADGQPTVRIG